MMKIANEGGIFLLFQRNQSDALEIFSCTRRLPLRMKWFAASDVMPLTVASAADFDGMVK